MPTKEELNLFSKGEGGSGNPQEDAHVVDLLSQALKVPSTHVNAFVKTRDRHTLHNLRHVLEEMPQRPGTTTGSGTPMMEMTRASSAPSFGSSAGHHTAKGLNRLNEMCKMTSSYNAFFSPGGKQVPKNSSPHHKAFANVRDDYKEGFEDWRKTASDGQLRVFAEACRTMRYFDSPGLHTTTYCNEFKQYDDMANARVKLPDKDMTVSNVPIGNLGKTSKSEIEALKQRERLREAQIAEARRRERCILEGTHNIAGIYSGTMKNTVLSKEHNMGDDQGVPAPARDWKALARASWNADVHTTTQTSRYDLKRLRAGEVERKDKERRNLFNKTFTASRDEGEKMFNVSNPKDPTGEKITRFTYAKYAGFVP